jgi:hypothetical protein
VAAEIFKPIVNFKVPRCVFESQTTTVWSGDGVGVYSECMNSSCSDVVGADDSLPTIGMYGEDGAIGYYDYEGAHPDHEDILTLDKIACLRRAGCKDLVLVKIVEISE